MEKINIAELLKDCPKGMELDCTMYEDVYFDYIDDVSDIINCYIQNSNNKTGISFNKYGHYSSLNKSKCVIFPKGKTTWEGFQRPFKGGDVAISDKGDIHLLRTKDSSYCAYRERWNGLPKFDKTITTDIKVVRHATEEEKEKLFQAIKDNGYKWNKETKTLEKLPKFKVGDKVVKKGCISVPILITRVGDTYYWSNTENSTDVLPIADQDNWELVPNKFDINTLIPFESRVLVRDCDDGMWKPTFWGKNLEDSNYRYLTSNGYYKQCIPYEGNEHLLGTINDCDKYYKTWE